MLMLLWLAAMSGQPSSLENLADKVIEAYGGRHAWEQVTSFRQTGTVIPATRAGEGKLTREWQRPDKLRVEIAYPSHTEVRIVDGDHGTQNGKESSGMGLDAMRLQAARLALPLLLVEKKSSLRRAGANSIEIPLGPTMSLTVDIDPATGRITKSTSKASGIEFTTEYSDFRSVDGLLFAFDEDNTAQGMKTGTNRISKVELSRTK